MSVMGTFPDIAERKGSLATSPHMGRKGEKIFRREGVLEEHNWDRADLTYVYPVNGSSKAVRVNLGGFLLSLPRLPESQVSFKAIQKWEGYVTEVGEETFCARLEPIVGEAQEQEAEIYIQEVDRDDRTLIQVGSVFYWSIGYLDTPSGRSRNSTIRFRRLPVWTRGELESANAEADRLKGLFDVE